MYKPDDIATLFNKTDKTRHNRAGLCIVEGCCEPVLARRMCSLHYKRWQVHGNPNLGKTRGKSGTGYIDRNGYHRKSKNAKETAVHRLVAEDLTGILLPKNAVIHHVDGNRANNSPSNLVICQDSAYHNLLHARSRALVATGDASARKCCRCGKWDAIDNLSKSGSQHYHAACNSEHVKKYKKVTCDV